MPGDLHIMTHTPWSGHMDLAMRSYQNGMLDLPILSRGYGALVGQATCLDQA